MGVPATKRLANYEAGLSPDHIGSIVTQKKPTMVTLAGASFEEQASVDARTRAILNGEGTVHTISIPNYLAFSNEVMSEKNRMEGGGPLVNEVAVILAKWKTRGLTEAILIKIRDGVFSIPAPTTPPA